MKRVGTSEDSASKHLRLPHSAMSNYQFIKSLGHGCFGDVGAYQTVSGTIVAIKRSRGNSSESDSSKTIFDNEVAIMNQLSHINVLKIITSFIEFGDYFIVSELMDYDLYRLTQKNKIGLGFYVVKHILLQILNGLDYIHSDGIYHRDLHSKNVLMSRFGDVKIADFGLSRDMLKEGGGPLTPDVVMIHNRPPELLLGSKEYDGGVDVWAVGCIFAEMVGGKPLFESYDAIGMLIKICKVLGTPTAQEWPGIEDVSYEGFKLPEFKGPIVKSIIPYFKFDRDAYKLLLAFLTFNPNKRYSAEDALHSAFFDTIHITFSGDWDFANSSSDKVKKIFHGNRSDLISIMRKVH